MSADATPASSGRGAKPDHAGERALARRPRTAAAMRGSKTREEGVRVPVAAVGTASTMTAARRGQR